MVRCIFIDCGGHDSSAEAILHGLQHIAGDLQDIRQRLVRIEHQEEHEMSAIDDLVLVAAAAVDALTKLEALVVAGQADNPQVAQVVADLRAAVDQAATIDGDNPPSAPTEPTPTA
jgi:hypothetical protein